MIIGLTTGCFDLFHPGHRHFLKQAAFECSLLIVAVNHDAWIKENKGAERPFHPLPVRMAAVRDFGEDLHFNFRRSALFTVIPFDGDDGALVRAIRPDYVIRGFDQSANFSTIPIVRVSQTPGFSTTLAAQQRSLK